MAKATSATAQATGAFQKARRWRHKKILDPVIDSVWNRLEAEKAEAEAQALLKSHFADDPLLSHRRS